MTKSTRGFASMTPERRAEIAAMGGKASGGNFKHNRTRASAAGAKGGRVSGGQFRENEERTKAAGRKGGAATNTRP